MLGRVLEPEVASRWIHPGETCRFSSFLCLRFTTKTKTLPGKIKSHQTSSRSFTLQFVRKPSWTTWNHVCFSFLVLSVSRSRFVADGICILENLLTQKWCRIKHTHVSAERRRNAEALPFYPWGGVGVQPYMALCTIG